jgi:hypothetical protein
MKRFSILFLMFVSLFFGANAGILDLFGDTDYTATYYDYADKEIVSQDVQVVTTDRMVELNTYNVPFYVKEQPFDVPTVKAPPVLWGQDDLYFPYQLEAHISKKSYETMVNPKPFANIAPNVAVVCRKAGCTRLNDKVTRQFLYNNLINIFINNKFSKINICEADPYTRACLSDSVRFGGRVGGTATVIQLASAYLADVRYTKTMNKLEVYLLYDLYVNGAKSQCSGALTSVEVFSNDQVLMRDGGYKCHITSGVPSDVFSMFNIDYIDLDYGIMGGYYSMGLSGESAAGGNGYMLMKFHKRTGLSEFKPNCDTDKCEGGGYEVPAGEYEVRPLKN